MTAEEPSAAEDRLDRALTLPRIGAAELWELMWRDGLVEHWLGAGSFAPARVGERAALSDRAGVWRQGRVAGVVWGRAVTFELGAAATWPATDGEGAVTISVLDVGAGVDDEKPTVRTQVTISESGAFLESHRDEIRLYWDAVLGRLNALVRRVLDRRDNPRQAIVVIHGIGEQEPGRTLRALRDSGVITGEEESTAFVKPDHMSATFELRRVTFPSNKDRVRPMTDVYELYWAHLIRDTTVRQVAGWARGLLFRWRPPRPLLPAFLVVWCVTVAVAAGSLCVLLGVWHLPKWLAAGGLAVLAAGVIWKVVGHGVVVDVLGDAARYLSPRPANIAHRQEIREAGVDLISKLHRSGDLDRIVVLGHSLGSVVAYDILTQAWIQLHASHLRPAKPGFKPLRAVERAIGESDPAAQDLQHAAWQQVRRNTQPWLVTDLVTVGSPLTYAEFLMARDKSTFGTDKADRVLPTCPPCTSMEEKSKHQRCSYETSYVGRDSRAERITFTTLDHAALFAVTRWTNLYFKVRAGGIIGDIVGGPVSPQLGPWVRDVELRSPVRRFAHTMYWKKVGSNAHLEALHEALAPESGQDLLRLAAEIPAYAIAERLASHKAP